MNLTINPFLATDGYKTGHTFMYPKGTSLVYSNFTPRSGRHARPNIGGVIVFGSQMMMRQIDDLFEKGFFSRPKAEVCNEIKVEYSRYLGVNYDISHIEALWDLQYLPISVKSIEEGRFVPYGVPVLTIYNTMPEFYWITNFLETLISNLLWKPMTSATTAFIYKQLLTKWAYKTDKSNVGFVDFQGHDFSMRGMDSIDATIASGLGHAISFLGSDSLPVIHGARVYYDHEGPSIYSVNATEHSVMCVGTGFYIAKNEGDWKHYGEAELEVFRQLLKDFPTGILSVVSDTWDLWKVLTEYLPALKDEILSRDGKLVIRPDSGDPVDIICGLQGKRAIQPEYTENEYKGVIELLWDTFGGTINEQGYKVLDPHIGAIYGDSITIERAQNICKRLEAKGYASTNVVLGIGSYTYQYNTRDTHGFAMKATYAEVKYKPILLDEDQGNMGHPNDNAPTLAYEINIFKDPITDDGRKKSARGLLQVCETPKGLQLKDQVSWDLEQEGALKTIYENGLFYNKVSLESIRKLVSLQSIKLDD